jgi:hypothetical protein
MELEVSEIEYRTTQAQMQSLINQAEAEKAVIAVRNAKEAEVLARQVEAFGSGQAYVKAKLYSRLMPGVESIIWNGAGQGVFGLPGSTVEKKGK